VLDDEVDEPVVDKVELDEVDMLVVVLLVDVDTAPFQSVLPERMTDVLPPITTALLGTEGFWRFPCAPQQEYDELVHP
jgi:hypothetical protein